MALLKVLSLNCNGKIANIRSFQSLIPKYKPEIVVLQECNPSQIKSLLEKNYKCCYQSGKLPYGKCNLTAISKAIKILETSPPIIDENLSRHSITYSCLYAGYQFSITCVHLKSGGDTQYQEQRAQQLDVILKKVKRNCAGNHLVVGDFNMRATEKFERKDWTWAPFKNTYCSHNKIVQSKYPNNKKEFGHPYDRAYYCGSWELNNSQVLKHQISDHYPILFEFSLFSSRKTSSSGNFCILL